jgi:hypothetical protein
VPLRHNTVIGEVDGLEAPRSGIHLASSTIEKLKHELAADTSVGAGDECDLVGDVDQCSAS